MLDTFSNGLMRYRKLLMMVVHASSLVIMK